MCDKRRPANNRAPAQFEFPFHINQQQHNGEKSTIIRLNWRMARRECSISENFSSVPHSSCVVILSNSHAMNNKSGCCELWHVIFTYCSSFFLPLFLLCNISFSLLFFIELHLGLDTLGRNHLISSQKKLGGTKERMKRTPIKLMKVKYQFY